MLKTRSTAVEVLDDLNFGGDSLTRIIRELSFINAYLGNTPATLQAFKKEIKNLNTPLRIIDLGCGGGDNLRAIAQWCSKNHLKVQLTGIDGNQNILDYANSLNNEYMDIEYKRADILDDAFEIPSCDFLISSHFMYHFSDQDMIAFLGKAQNKVRKAIIISELHRHIFAFYMFRIFGKLLPFSKIVKDDGLVAIKRSYKRKELENILERAGITTYSIEWKWAFRFLLVIRFS